MDNEVYDITVSRGARSYSFTDAAARIDSPNSSEIISQVISALIKTDHSVTEENVFCEATAGIMIEELGGMPKNDELESFKYVARNTYKVIKEGLQDYRKNYYEQIATFIEAPILIEKNGVKCHISATSAFSSAIDELKAKGSPYNRYAANGCINTMRRVLQAGKTNLVWTYTPMITDPSMQEWADESSFSALEGILNYFFLSFSFIRKAKYREMIMREIKLLCDGNQKSRDFFLEFYELHTELFDELFLEYPEYVFIVRGRYKRYEVIMDLAERLELSIQDRPEIELFFLEKGKSGSRDTESETKKSVIKSRYAFDMKEHQTRLIKAFDSFTQRLLKDGEDYQIYNFWPNETLEKRSAKPIGPYIAVAFKRNDKWCLLIDGIYERCAIYIWTGDKLLDGLSIFKTSKCYARQQPNVCHMNHRGTVESYEITYRKALSKIS